MACCEVLSSNCILYQVVLHSRHSKGGSLFAANTKTGKSNLITIPKGDNRGVNYADSALAIPSQYNPSEGRISSALVSGKVAVPTAGFR